VDVKRLLLAACVVLVWTIVVLPAQPDNSVHFHHAHLNVTDTKASSQFYQQIFGAVPVKFGNRSDAVFTERSFLLFSQVAASPASDLDTGIWHLGWGGVDGPREYNTLTGKGVRFQTPITPLNNNYYMYAFGPDKELLEIWTGYQNHRYGHVHLISADPVGTVRWYTTTLGIPLRSQTINEPGPASAGSNGLQNVDNVNIIVFRQPASEPVPPLWAGNKTISSFESTQGHAVDHLAFSYRKIDPVFSRMKKAGVRIVEPITTKTDYGFRSFFIEGPDKVLIEIVEAKPIPEASWE
jgi:catechol 2,3-dioxygenase-like lactoylglutathione lyase family enzyme